MTTKSVAWAYTIKESKRKIDNTGIKKERKFNCIIPSIRRAYPDYKVNQSHFFELNFAPIEGHYVSGWCFNTHRHIKETIEECFNTLISEDVGLKPTNQRFVYSYPISYSDTMTVEDFERHIMVFENIEIGVNLPKDHLIPRYTEMNPTNGGVRVSNWLDKVIKTYVGETVVNLKHTNHSPDERISNLRKGIL